MNRLTLNAAGIVLVALAGFAHADTNFSKGARVEVLYSGYSNEYLNCWNNGNPATCANAPHLWQGDSYVRGGVSHDLNDDMTLIGQAQLAYYLNNARYTRSQGAKNPNDPHEYDPTETLLEVEDTWVGVKDERYGVVKVGRGLNPRMLALEGGFTTDLGGKEMLEKMISYDSPIVGNRNTGIKFSYALYKGAHMRKEMRRYDSNDEAQMSRVEPTGSSILLDATLRTKLNVKFAYYKERFAARDNYPDGKLDGAPGAGVMTSAHGPALKVSYDLAHGRIGFSSSRNTVDKVAMVTPSYPSVGFNSRTNTLFFGLWNERWSLWSTVSKSKYRLSDADFLYNPATVGNEWIYPNTTRDIYSYGGEISYQFRKNTRAVVGVDFRKYTFYNSPLATNGMCKSTGDNSTNPCYNPHGYWVFSGLRWTY